MERYQQTLATMILNIKNPEVLERIYKLVSYLYLKPTKEESEIA